MKFVSNMTSPWIGMIFAGVAKVAKGKPTKEMLEKIMAIHETIAKNER